MADPTDSEARAEEIDQTEKPGEAKAEVPRDKPKKRSGKGRSKGDKAKGSAGAAIEAPAAEAKASEGRAAYLAGHAVIWLGVLGSVAYLIARGR